MRVEDFQYELPPELIARYPLSERTMSRLFCLDKNTGHCEDKQFQDLVDLIKPGDLIVFNDTRVIPARILGEKATGGKVEVLVERILDPHSVLAHIKSNKSPKEGTQLKLAGQLDATVTGREGDLFTVDFHSEKSVLAWLERIGQVPLPPYVQREPDDSDNTRYQTVFAKNDGAVAAPTAGLHFDEPMMRAIVEKGVDTAFVTLHVGAGTFQPVRVENIKEHKMHSEFIEVSQDVSDKIMDTKETGGRIIAVGTTTVRALETAALKTGQVQPYRGETEVFIYPGFKFNCIDALVTNFHLPLSTLLMLVSAFAGYDHMMAAYEHAIQRKYRFYSYGDAMFIADFEGVK